MLCGYEPFYGETDAELVASNKAAVIEFPSEDWGHVSAEAKDLVQQMMKVNAEQRLDARQALQHPWFVAQLGGEAMNTASLDRIISRSNEGPAERREGACEIS